MIMFQVNRRWLLTEMEPSDHGTVSFQSLCRGDTLKCTGKYSMVLRIKEQNKNEGREPESPSLSRTKPLPRTGSIRGRR